MKNKIIYVVLCAIALISCEDYLDKDISTDLYADAVFVEYESTCHVARSVYTNLPDGFSEVWASTGSAMMASATDEAEFAIQNHNVQKFNTGSWHQSDMPDNPWNNYYKGIRKAINFTLNCDRVNYDKVRYDTSKPGVYEEQLEDINLWKHEVMLLRAYFLFELVKRYGGVPIISELYGLNFDYTTLKRNTLQECVDEIVFWCDSTAKVLPSKRKENDLGRLTSGAALAIKSQVLLYAASDLWNDPSWAEGYAHPELISLPVADRKERWKMAADAAKDVINNGGYRLDNPTTFFGATTFKSNEVIFCKRADGSNNFERVNFPISYNYATGGNCPSQNLVDAFQIKISNREAVDFDWNNPEHAADPYAKRDPRLAAFIVTNNSSFKGKPVEAWTGGLDGNGIKNATPTGYYLKKYVQSDLDLVTDKKGVHTWVIIRYAEILLNYIEALNEYDPGNPDIKKYYDQIRNRTGVLMPGLPVGLVDQDKVRELIRKERYVELCFEGKRWFDARRWMKGEEILGAPVKAVEITKNGNKFTYEPYELENRVFQKKMYFYPIYLTEINKLPEFVQNPLW